MGWRFLIGHTRDQGKNGFGPRMGFFLLTQNDTGVVFVIFFYFAYDIEDV